MSAILAKEWRIEEVEDSGSYGEGHTHRSVEFGVRIRLDSVGLGITTNREAGWSSVEWISVHESKLRYKGRISN